MESMNRLFDQIPQWAVPFIISASLVVYAAPTLVAWFRNRRALRRIAAINLVAGFSWPTWMAVMAWAVSGRPDGGLAQLRQRPRIQSVALFTVIVAVVVVGVLSLR